MLRSIRAKSAGVLARVPGVGSRKKKATNTSTEQDGAPSESSGLRVGLLSGKAPEPKKSPTGKTGGRIGELPVKEKKTSIFAGNGGRARTSYGSKAQDKATVTVTSPRGRIDVVTTFTTVSMHTRNKFSSYVKHIVMPDDNFARLSLKYGVTVQDIKLANNLHPSDTVFSLEELLIPCTDGNRDMGEIVQLGDEEAAYARRSTSPESEGEAPASPTDFFAKFDSKFAASRQRSVEQTAPVPLTLDAALYPKKAAPLGASRIGAGVAGDTAHVGYQTAGAH